MIQNINIWWNSLPEIWKHILVMNYRIDKKIKEQKYNYSVPFTNIDERYKRTFKQKFKFEDLIIREEEIIEIIKT